MKTNIKTVFSSILLGSLALVPVSSAFAQLELVSDVTVDVTPVSATVAATTSAPVPTLYMRDGVQKLNEQKREELKKIEENRRLEIQRINEQKKEGFRDLKEQVKGEREELRASSTERREEMKNERETLRASSTEKREEMRKEREEDRKERREEMVKRQMASTTDRLLNLSTKLGKLGVDIKAAVEAQASSSLVITSAMTKVEARSAFKTFFLGSDYKNLGQMVSEAAKTTARINQIESQVSKMSSSTDKTALVESLTELKTQSAELEAYVKENEGKFSLFGWFTKRFNK